MKKTDEEIAEIVRLYGEGNSIRAVAKTVERSYGFTYNVLTDAQVTLRKRGGSKKTVPAEAQ